MERYLEKGSKMDQKTLSVIVLTYKHGKLLYECIDSILMQDYPYIELIIAEDGEKDFDKKAVEEYIAQKAKPNVISTQIIANETNIGTVKNINQAILCSNGDYVKVIAGDDSYPTPDVFSKQIEYLSENDTLFVVGNTIECDSEMSPLTKKGFAPEKKEKLLIGNRKKLLRRFCKKSPHLFATQAICFKKEFFTFMGLFDERYRLVEDLPFAIKIIISNIPIGYQDIDCVNHRGSVGVSTSNNAFDAKKMAYYTDLKSYHENCLIPISNAVGKVFVKMRYGLACFRIEYVGSTGFKKLKLLVKYFLPLAYYVLSKPGRTKFYMSKGNK